MDVDQVMQFLRANGLSAVEFALKEDIKESNTPLLDSCDLVSFSFPLNAPLPPVRLLSSSSRPGKDSLGSDCSEDDEFVSLDSSTTEICSSDFTNPYGRHSVILADSEASSSDSLSQFGTAREYHEFNMQTDLWYDDKEEGHHLTPNVVGGPSEEKFAMTSDISNLADHPFSFNIRPRDKENDMNSQFSTRDSSDDVKFDKENHYFYFDEKGRLEFDEFNLEGDVLSELVKHKQDVVYDHSLEGWTNLSRNSTEKNLKFAFRWNSDRYDVSDEKEILEAYEVVTEQEATTPEELPILATAGDVYEVFDLRIIHRRNRTGFEENRELPIVLNSTLAGRYYVTEYLGSAAFSKVVQAHDIQTGLDVCLKIIKNDKDFFDQSLDEIKLLKYVNKHDPSDEHHILRLYDYFYHQEHLFIVCELLKANLYEFQKYTLEMDSEPYFTMDRLQAVTRQSLEALDFLHGLGIIHCDLKPENILIKSYSRCEIKVIDLGSSCFLTDNLSLYVQSRSYRAPEVILGLSYGPKIDIWSFGCILAELCSGEVLFPNDEVVMLLARVVSLLGPISVEMLLRGQETHKYFTKEYNLYYINEATNEPEYIVPEKSSLDDHLAVSDSGFLNFVKYLLQVNPKKRPTAKEALQHPWLLHQY